MATTQRVQYGINISANTSQAKQAIADLQRSIQSLQNTAEGDNFLNEKMNKAAAAAKELQLQLAKATNVNTGKLNLSLLNDNLKASGKSAQQLMISLLEGGRTGQQAFASMANAIAQAEVPLKQTNKLIADFGNTLKNTVKWEISSNLVHGLESAMSGAVSYAKNLNSSLTDIRIVTGQSTEQMAKFAQYANKAAKDLSTSTRSYADAALIYYQQGDSDAMAKKKAELTIKAANASFDSDAKEMSEYLTAVWNSYQVGSDQLEHYIDVMASLGAKTATSLEEIATSMQKVAATANTVGVSMEQMSSIISTVSSVTREAPESIGTSYKTILARMGDLKLGGSDEDGVTLGTVSSQLDKIGVKILDANNDLRDMGDIIWDLGEKWQTMNTATKSAVAQAVAGKRQYTQLMALFDNWDMYKENLQISANSDGALEQMANTYAESWEAASKRVQASLEGIYGKLLDDQGFIKILNITSALLDKVTSLIDGFGGLAGILTKLGSVATVVFGQQMASRIDKNIKNIKLYFSQFSGVGDFKKKFLEGNIKSARQIQTSNDFNEFSKALTDSQSRATDPLMKQSISSAQTLLNLKQQLLENEYNLSDAQKQRAQEQIALLGEEQSKLQEILNNEEQAKKDANSQTALIRRRLGKNDKVGDYNPIWTTNGADHSANEELSKILYGALGFEFKNNSFIGKNLSLSNINHAANYNYGIFENMRQMSSKDDMIKFLNTTSVDDNTKKAIEEKIKDVGIKQAKEYLKALSDGAEQVAVNIGQEINKRAGEQLEDQLEEAFLKIQDETNNRTSAFQTNGLIEEKVGKIETLVSSVKEKSADIGKNLVSAGQTAANFVDSFQTAASAFSAMTDDSATLETKLGSISNIMMTLGNVLVSQNPLLIASTIIGGIFGIISQAQTQAKELQKEQWDKTNKKATNILEEEQSNNSSKEQLLQQYNSLYNTYLKTGEGQDALKESAKQLAEAYGLVGVNLDIASGKFDVFNQKLAESIQNEKAASLEKVKTERDNIQTSISQQLSSFYSKNKQMGLNMYSLSAHRPQFTEDYIKANEFQKKLESRNQDTKYTLDEVDKYLKDLGISVKNLDEDTKNRLLQDAGEKWQFDWQNSGKVPIYTLSQDILTSLYEQRIKQLNDNQWNTLPLKLNGQTEYTKNNGKDKISLHGYSLNNLYDDNGNKINLFDANNNFTVNQDNIGSVLSSIQSGISSFETELGNVQKLIDDGINGQYELTKEQIDGLKLYKDTLERQKEKLEFLNEKLSGVSETSKQYDELTALINEITQQQKLLAEAGVGGNEQTVSFEQFISYRNVLQQGYKEVAGSTSELQQYLIKNEEEAKKWIAEFDKEGTIENYKTDDNGYYYKINENGAKEYITNYKNAFNQAAEKLAYSQLSIFGSYDTYIQQAENAADFIRSLPDKYFQGDNIEQQKEELLKSIIELYTDFANDGVKQISESIYAEIAKEVAKGNTTDFSGIKNTSAYRMEQQAEIEQAEKDKYAQIKALSTKSSAYDTIDSAQEIARSLRGAGLDQDKIDEFIGGTISSRKSLLEGLSDEALEAAKKAANQELSEANDNFNIQKGLFQQIIADNYDGEDAAIGILKDLSVDQEGNILYQGKPRNEADKNLQKYLNSPTLATDMAIYQAYTAAQTKVNTAQDKVNGYELLNTDKVSKATKYYQTLTNALSGLPETAEEMKELSDATGKSADELYQMTDTQRIETVTNALKNLKPQISNFLTDKGEIDWEAYYASLSKWEMARASVTQAAVSSLESSLAIIDKRVEKTQKEIDKQQSIIDDMTNAFSENRMLKGGEAWGLDPEERQKYNNADWLTRVSMLQEKTKNNNELELQNTKDANKKYNAIYSRGQRIREQYLNDDSLKSETTIKTADDIDNYLKYNPFRDVDKLLIKQAISSGNIALTDENGKQRSDYDILMDIFGSNGYFRTTWLEAIDDQEKTNAQKESELLDNILDLAQNSDNILFSDIQKIAENGTVEGIGADYTNSLMVNGHQVRSSDEAQTLQEAIQKALGLAAEDDWNKVEDRDLLSRYGIEGFDQLESASTECANAIQSFAGVVVLVMNALLTQAGFHTTENDVDDQGHKIWRDAKGHALDDATQQIYNGAVDNASHNYNEDNDKAIKQIKLKSYGLDADEVNKFGDRIQEIATDSDELADSLKDDAEAADEVAKEMSRYSNAVADVAKNYKTWMKALKSNDLKKQSDAVKDLRTTYGNLLDLDYDALPDSFLASTKNLELMQKAIKGSQSAYDQLQSSAAQAIYETQNGSGSMTSSLKESLESLATTATKVGEEFNENWDASVNSIENAISSNSLAYQLSSAYTQAYDAAIVGGASVQQAMAMANQMIEAEGFNVPEMEAKTITVTGTLPPGWEPQPDGSVTTVDTGGKTVTVQGVRNVKHDGETYTWEQTILTPKSKGKGFTKSAERVGGGGSKSSGGGGGKKKQNKDYKLASDEIDRYHYVEQRLKRTNAQLTENDKFKEKAYGSEYLSYLDSEISKLKDLKSEYVMYRNEAAGYLASDRARMAELGAQFDVEGNIKNYEEMRKAWLDAYNAGVDAWNNSDQEEGAELAFKQVEKQYEEKTKALQKYEESLEKYEEAQNNILEQQNKVAEALLEKIQTKLEYTTKLNETDLKLLEHYSKRYEGQLADQGKSMMNILNQAKQYEENLQAVTEAQAALNAQYAAGQLTDAKYQEGLADLIDKSLEYADALEDLKNDIKEVYQNALDLADEELEKHTAKIDAAKEAVQSYIDILGLLGRGENFANLQKYYYGIYENSLQNLKVQKAYLDTLNQQAEYFEGKGTQMTELEKEQYEALQEKIRDVNSEVLSSTQDTLSALQDAYNNAISDIFKKLDDAMGGAEDSVQALADKYGYYQEEQQRYVSTAKELYEVSKLNRSIEQSIEDSTTAASKERLKALQKLIAAQSKANKLTQYDLDMMNLQYQLALAMEELENAKNAKDTVRLTRDDNGNYGYQYTADQDKINNAQQKYEDVLQQINELAANRISELEQSFLNAQQQYLQSAQEIASDMTLTEEQRAEKLANLQKQYAETMKYIQEQYNTAFKELSVNQEAISKHYGETLVETTSSTALQVNDQMKSMIDNIDTYIENLNKAIGTEGAASTAWNNYVSDIAKVAEALTGINTGNVQANIDALTKALAESMSKYSEESKDTVDEAQKTFNTIANSLKSVNDATEAWNKHAETIERTETAYEKLAETMQKNIKILANGATYSDIFDTPDSNSDNPLSTGTVKAPTISRAEATGGLSSVIEANFTNKVSTSIGEATARALSDSLRTQIEAYIAALNTNFDTIGGALKSSSWTIEQNVHIDASFPNVQDHNEIEEAINDLINSATQYANRKGE